MDGIARLEATEAIKQLKSRYFRHLDTKDWEQWRTVFTDDVELDVASGLTDRPDFVVQDADAVVARVAAELAGTTTVHHGHTPEILVDGEDRAHGVWAMEDNLYFADGSRMVGYGHYHETYRKVGNSWKIAGLRLTRLKVVTIPV